MGCIQFIRPLITLRKKFFKQGLESLKSGRRQYRLVVEMIPVLLIKIDLVGCDAGHDNLQ